MAQEGTSVHAVIRAPCVGRPGWSTTGGVGRMGWRTGPSQGLMAGGGIRLV